MKNQLRVLIITNLFPNNKEPYRGIFIKQQSNELAKLCDLQVVAPVSWFPFNLKLFSKWSINAQIVSQEEIDGIKTYHPKWIATPKILRSLYGFFYFFSILPKILQVKQSFQFNLIYAHWIYPDGFAAVLLGKVLKKPVILHARGCDINLYTKYFFRRKMIVYALKNCSKIIAVSSALKTRMVEIGIPKEKIKVILNGVNTDLFRLLNKNECRKTLKLPPEKKIVLFVGNLEKVKGVDILINAMQNLDGNTCLVLVGDGKLKSDLKLRVKSLNLENRITFNGARLHSEIPLFMNACDVLCLPSRSEGCPNVLLEALACGIPVVATKVGGIPEIITSEDYGILVPPQDPKALAQGIQEALKKNWDLMLLRERGAEKTWQKNAISLLNECRTIQKSDLNRKTNARKKAFIFSIIFASVFFLGTQLAFSREPANLYVSPRGSYVGGCTQAHPCREIDRAISFSIPGDTITIMDGDYQGFTISGFQATEMRPLTIKAQNRNKTRILPSSKRKNNRDNIYITQSDWIIIDGLVSLNAPRAGIRVDNSHNVNIRNSTFANNGVWGIFTNHSNDLCIENNECYGSREQHGIYVSNSADRPTIRGNKVYDNYACGIHLNGDLSTGGGRDVTADGIISEAVIENNVIFNNGRRGGAGINMDSVQDSIIRNNLLYNNHAGGITAFVIDGGAGPKNIKIYNNTIDMAADSRWAILANNTIGKIIIMNNILYSRNPVCGALSIGNKPGFPSLLKIFGLMVVNQDVNNVHSDYNIFGGSKNIVTTDDNISRFKLSSWQKTKNDLSSQIYDLNHLVINADKGNYKLKANSPAIGQGIFIKDVSYDIRGNKRPMGKGADIGAFGFYSQDIATIERVEQ